MFWPKIVLSALLALALTVPAALADDICGGDKERAQMAAEAKAAIAKAEKSGNKAELFLAYRDAAENDCLSKDLMEKGRAGMVKVGRELAKAAEAKGWLYATDPVAVQTKDQRRANDRASAFAWFEAAQDYNEANRVMLKAVHAKSDNLALFKAAWDADQSRFIMVNRFTGERKPYASPASYRQELQKIASANAERLMKAEEKDAAGLSGSATAVATATMSSLDKLHKAAEWMKFLPGVDKPARERAEQRGDTIMKRSDPTFTAMNAKGYYEFAGTSKAKEKLAQLDKKAEESQRALEKSGKSIEGAITQKGEAEQKKFDKGKANLEKELGF